MFGAANDEGDGLTAGTGNASKGSENLLHTISGPSTDKMLAALADRGIDGADFQTAQTVVNAIAQPDELQTETLLGLVRMVNGKIKAGAKMHVLNPEGVEIGLLPKSKHVIADVDPDVSRRHARIWREGGHWLIEGLESTNGTCLISGATGAETIVEPPRATRSASFEATPVEIAATDIIALGATTRFMVLPVLE